MDSLKFNPVVRNIAFYERAIAKAECRAYDSRLIYIVSGDVTAVVDGEKLGHLGAGNLLYIPAGVPYTFKSTGVRTVVISFDPSADSAAPEEYMPPVASAEFDEALCHSKACFAPFDRVMLLTDMETERDELIKMSKLFTSGEGMFRDVLSARLKLLLIKLCEASDEDALPTRMVEALDEYIRENVGDEISNTEIGAIFGYHPFYVSRILKEKKGQTLRQYVISYRLKLATTQLITTDKSVAEIAEECGFTDASYFTKTFKIATGKTPKDFRKDIKRDFI